MRKATPQLGRGVFFFFSDLLLFLKRLVTQAGKQAVWFLLIFLLETA
jgi:hypothetical protein